MVTLNITFAIDPRSEHKFLIFVKEELLPLLKKEGINSYHLKKVIEAGGEKPDPTHALSLAFGIDFESEEKAHQWSDSFLPSIFNKFQAQLGKESLFFTTLLENILI